MAKYFIQDETLTNLADKIRILNGTEDTMTPDEMNSELESANEEVDSQSTLIDQLSEMLEGKATGSGSGDYVVGTATLDDEGNLTIPELIGKSRFIIVRESTTMLPVITGGHLGIVDTLYCLDGSLITAKMYKAGAVELLDSVITYDNTTGAFSYDHTFVTITFEDTNYIYIAW